MHPFYKMKDSIAVIDIGTNSIKFCMAKNSNGIIQPLADSVHITRIGENFQQTGKISPSAMERNLPIIHELCDRARQSGVSQIIAIGTMIFRHASNADHFIQQVKTQCGIHIHVLSGDDEARLSYLAAISSIHGISGDIIVIDTGGGSTELTFGKDKNIVKSMSFNIGAVLLTEKFCKSDPVAQHNIEQLYKHIQSEIDLNRMKNSVDYLIGSCGAITTMASMKFKLTHYDSNAIHGSILTRRDVQKQLNLLASKTTRQRKEIPGIQNGREDIALAGVCIVDCLMAKLKCDQIIVCDRGIRYGMIDEFFKKSN
jgi:exopolyphosphatase/guanosine-5'-triphosphate,3'-diphosphate pyrophosphatase